MSLWGFSAALNVNGKKSNLVVCQHVRTYSPDTPAVLSLTGCLQRGKTASSQELEEKLEYIRYVRTYVCTYMSHSSYPLCTTHSVHCHGCGGRVSWSEPLLTCNAFFLP